MIVENTSAIADLNTLTASIESRVNIMETDINNLEGRIEEVELTVSGHEQRILSLE